jgi:hypothetical protein
MATPATEVKAAVATETKGLEARLTALEVKVETSAKTWYEKHLPLLAGIAGALVGGLIGHLVRHL